MIRATSWVEPPRCRPADRQNVNRCVIHRWTRVCVGSGLVEYDTLPRIQFAADDCGRRNRGRRRAALAGPREAPRIWRAAPRPSSSSLSSARAAQASSLRRPPRSGRLPARSSSVSISRPRPPSLLVEPLFEWKERSARLPRPPDVPRGPPHPLLSPLSPLPVPLPVLTRTPSLRSTRM